MDYSGKPFKLPPFWSEAPCAPDRFWQNKTTHHSRLPPGKVFTPFHGFFRVKGVDFIGHFNLLREFFSRFGRGTSLFRCLKKVTEKSWKNECQGNIRTLTQQREKMVLPKGRPFPVFTRHDASHFFDTASMLPLIQISSSPGTGPFAHLPREAPGSFVKTGAELCFGGYTTRKYKQQPNSANPSWDGNTVPETNPFGFSLLCFRRLSPCDFSTAKPFGNFSCPECKEGLN